MSSSNNQTHDQTPTPIEFGRDKTTQQEPLQKTNWRAPWEEVPVQPPKDTFDSTKHTEVILSSVSIMLLIIITFVGIGMTYRNKNIGEVLGVIAASIMIVPHIYMYGGVIYCTGINCMPYVLFPALTAMPSSICCALPILLMYMIKSSSLDKLKS